MDLYIYNQSLVCLGVVDEFESLLWVRKFFESGEFEIYAPRTDTNLALLREGYLVARDDAVECGIINSQKYESTEDGDMITASGAFLSGLLDRRIIWSRTELDTEVEAIMRRLVSDNAITSHPIPYLTLGILNGFTETAAISVQGDNLGAYLPKLAQVSLIGYRIVFDRENLQLVFETYKPLDRSVNQTELPQIIFSDEDDNFTEPAYEKSNIGHINVVLVRFEDENNTLTEEVGAVGGFDRFEAFLDFTEGVYDEDDNLLEAETRAAMRTAGQQAMVDLSESFTGTLDTSNMEYKADFDLGDIITAYSAKYNQTLTARIYEIEECYDREGTKIIPTLGTPQASLLDILKEE